jgi:tetratricopeptide (TPR) repeat protein
MSPKHALHASPGPSKQEQAEQLIQGGMLAHRQGRFADAVRAYEKALKKAPTQLTALNLLADAQLNLGKNTRALKTIARALSINPDMPSAWLVRGAAQRRMGEFPSAIESLKKSLELKPDSSDALMTLAGTLRDSGDLDAAIDTYEDLVAMAPELSKAHYNLGNALVDDKQFDEAILAYEEAVRLDPTYGPAQINLASAFHADDRLEEALLASTEAIKLEPASRNARLNHANILKSLSRLDEAESIYREIIADEPKDADAHDLLGTVLQGQTRFDEAIAAYQTAVQLDPRAMIYKGDLSTALLANGQLAEGWKAYSARFGKSDHLVHQRKIGNAVWQGEPLAGKTLLVWREQGVGDDIRFASCFPDLLARVEQDGGKLIIETDPRLITLYARSFPTATIRAAGEKSAEEKIDYDIAAGSVPGILRTTIGSFPDENVFLKPKAERVETFREEIDALGSGLKVGISWRSRNMASSRSRFYTSLSEWKALFGRDDIQLINLQYGNVTNEVDEVNAQLAANIHVVEGMDLMNDLDGAAALSSAVDVVISAGTSVSDMAGAVGAQTYIYGAHRHPMCLGAENFPWYPSVTWVGHRWNEPLAQSVDKISAHVLKQAAERG